MLFPLFSIRYHAQKQRSLSLVAHSSIILLSRWNFVLMETGCYWMGSIGEFTIMYTIKWQAVSIRRIESLKYREYFHGPLEHFE